MFNLSDLPDEILCEILKYLSAFDALYSFLDLNFRFTRLLSPFKQQIDLTNVSYEHFLYYINDIIPVISKHKQLYTLKLGNRRTPGQIRLFNQIINNTLVNQHKYFTTVEKFFLEDPRLEEFIDFIDNYLKLLPKLTTLSIKIDSLHDTDFPKWTNLVLHSILPISSLNKLSITIPAGLGLSRLSETHMFNSLIDLNLNVSTVTDLLILIKRIPNVENLSIRVIWWTSGDRTLVRILDEMRSDQTRTSLLTKLKQFSLTVDSIMTFQYEHLDQILYRVLNNHVTSSFTFSLRNCMKSNADSTIQLLDGQAWEKLLSPYSSLNEFHLFIRISDSSNSEEEQYYSKSFQRKYFLEKQWFFSYLKHARKNFSLLYSTPNKILELFDISLNTPEKFHHFPINYSLNLLIDETDTKYYLSNGSLFSFLLNQFPSLQELTLTDIDLNTLIINPINIPSLHTLKIEKTPQIILHNLLEVFPLINTLFISYCPIHDQNQSFE
ncbi:hypothetical protein I4U23_006591 [Adineta vaga]|nr:hypothetical protein I4U23_006591 [Adineta vaga]